MDGSGDFWTGSYVTIRISCTAQILLVKEAGENLNAEVQSV